MNLFNIFEGLWRGGEPQPIDYQGWRYVPELLVDVDVTKKVHHVFDPSGRELLGKENPFDSADSRMFGPYGTWASESEFKKFVDSQETTKPKPSLPVPVATAGAELEEEPEPVKTASKNRFDPTKPVEAYGYVYDRRDQRQHWSKTFPNEAALDLWVRRNNATVIGMLNKESEAGVPATEEYAIYANGRMIKKAANQADAERALLKIQHEHPGEDFEIRRRSMVLTSALAEAARVGNVYRDDVPGTYGAAITDKQYIESGNKDQEDMAEARNKNDGNLGGPSIASGVAARRMAAKEIEQELARGVKRSTWPMWAIKRNIERAKHGLDPIKYVPKDKKKGVAEDKQRVTDQETIDFVNQELAHTIKTKFNGIAWFNGGSYSYLLNIKKPNAMQASDGSPIRVKSWAQGIKDYADRWVWDELENSYPDYWETFLRPYKKGEGQPEHEYHSRFGESVTEGSRKFNWYNFMRTIYKLYLANAKFSSADLKADVSDVMLSSDKFFPTEYADALSESLEEGNVSWILQDVKYALREIHENVIDYYSNSWNFPPGFKPGKFSIAFKGVNSNVLKKVIIPLLPKAKKVAEVQQQGVAEGQSQNSKQSLNFCSDKTPKSTGLTFEQLNKLTESAGMDFEKFDTALKKNLNLPAWVNTLEIFGVYARKLNEQKNGRLLVETQLTDIEKNLFNELDRYSNESIDSAKIGDKVALLHLQTIDIPGHKVVAQLNGFLHPKEITGITSNKGFKQLKFADGSMFPKNDDDIAFHMIQSWNMTKLFPNYDSASKAYLMFAIQGDNQNKDLEFKINVAKNMNEGDVIHTKFATKQAQRGRDRYHKVEGLDIPVFDRAVGRAMPPNLAKDPMPFDHFVARRGKIMNRGVTKQGNWYSIIGVLPNGKEYTASTTPSEQLANALADAYNRGGFSDTDLKRVPVKGYDESTAPITKRYVLYLNDKPAAHYASKSEAESQAAMVLAKHPNTKYKILAKNQGMLESNNKGKNMRLKELTEGISSQDLGNVLFDRLEHRFPDIVAQHGHEVVADAVMHVAEFHAGAEELGSSDISIMLKQILEYIKDRQ